MGQLGGGDFCDYAPTQCTRPHLTCWSVSLCQPACGFSSACFVDLSTGNCKTCLIACCRQQTPPKNWWPSLWCCIGVVYLILYSHAQLYAYLLPPPHFVHWQILSPKLCSHFHNSLIPAPSDVKYSGPHQGSIVTCSCCMAQSKSSLQCVASSTGSSHSTLACAVRHCSCHRWNYHSAKHIPVSYPVSCVHTKWVGDS